jgi:MtN3 and saliva related transmembrane protein
MSAVDVLGYMAASLTTVSFVPQAAKTLRTGDTAAISLRMYLLFTSGVALWGLYGLLRGDGPLVVANAITLVSAGLILQCKLRAVLAGHHSRSSRTHGGSPGRASRAPRSGGESRRQKPVRWP